VHSNSSTTIPEATSETAELFTGTPAHGQESSKPAPKRLLEPRKLAANPLQKNYFQQIKMKAIEQKYRAWPAIHHHTSSTSKASSPRSFGPCFSIVGTCMAHPALLQLLMHFGPFLRERALTQGSQLTRSGLDFACTDSPNVESNPRRPLTSPVPSSHHPGLVRWQQQLKPSPPSYIILCVIGMAFF